MRKTKKCAGLAQEIGFALACLHILLMLAKGTANVCTCQREECNNHDLFPVSDWSRWFAISSLLAIFSLNFSFMGGF